MRFATYPRRPGRYNPSRKFKRVERRQTAAAIRNWEEPTDASRFWRDAWAAKLVAIWTYPLDVTRRKKAQ